MDGILLWLVVVDDHGARLFRGRELRQANRTALRLEELASIENRWLELDGDLATGQSRHHAGDRRSELLARYVLDVASWISEGIRRHHIERLDVLAPTRLESLLRSMHAATLGAKVTLHREDLSERDKSRLEREPAILRLAELHRSRRAS